MPPKPTPSSSGSNAAVSSPTNNNEQAPSGASATPAASAAPMSVSAKAAAAIGSAMTVDAPSAESSATTGTVTVASTTAATTVATTTAAAPAPKTAKPAAKKATKKKAATKKTAASAGSTLKKKKKASSTSAASASGSSASNSATGAVLLPKTTAAGIGAKLGAKAAAAPSTKTTTAAATAAATATAKKPTAPKLQKAPKLPKPAPGNSAVANIQFSSAPAKSTSSSPKNSPTKAKAKAKAKAKVSSSSPKSKSTSSASASSKSKSKSGSGGSTIKSSSSNSKKATNSTSAGTTTTSSSSAITSTGTPPSSAALLAQKAKTAKLLRSQIASRELQEMDAMERAFKEDMSVWCRRGGDEEFSMWMKGSVGGSEGSGQPNGRNKTGNSSSILWPKRYHEESSLLRGEFPLGKKNDWGKLSDVADAYLSFYGSQSQGWMYGEGHAGIGGRSWMEATLGVSGGISGNDNDEAAGEAAKGYDAKADSMTKVNNVGGKNTTMPPSAIPNITSSAADPTVSVPSQVSSMQQSPTAAATHNPSTLTKDFDSSTCRSDVMRNKPKGFLMDDVTIIENALKANGLSRADVTPKAYACFLEQARRYALELLADAQDYAIHAQRNTLPTLLPEDLHLAAQLRGDLHGIPSSLPTFEELSEFASEVNRVPLPPIPTNCYDGVVLPPVEQQLTARTFDVVNGARVVQRMMRGGEAPSTAFDIGLVKKSNNALMDAVMAESSIGDKGAGNTGEKTNSFRTSVSKAGSRPVKGDKSSKLGAYGAGRGRQIAVNIKSNKGNGLAGDGSKTGPAETESKSSGTAVSGNNTSGSTSTKSSSTAPKRKLTEL